jgi:hypothetical protein
MRNSKLFNTEYQAKYWNDSSIYKRATIVLIFIVLIVFSVLSLSALIVAVKTKHSSQQMAFKTESWGTHTEICAGLVYNKNLATNKTYGMLGKITKLSAVELEYMIEVIGVVVESVDILGPIDLFDSTQHLSLSLCGHRSEHNVAIPCSQVDGVIKGTWKNGIVNRIYSGPEDAINKIFQNTEFYYISIKNAIDHNYIMNIQARSC